MTEDAKKHKREYIADYQRRCYTNISFKFRTKEDKEVLDFLRAKKNKSGYIKNLIICDMSHGK